MKRGINLDIIMNLICLSLKLLKPLEIYIEIALNLLFLFELNLNYL